MATGCSDAMIKIEELDARDIGRSVVYRRAFSDSAVGQLTSWNEHYVFVRFKGPNGEACKPEDVSFEFGLEREQR